MRSSTLYSCTLKCLTKYSKMLCACELSKYGQSTLMKSPRVAFSFSLKIASSMCLCVFLDASVNKKGAVALISSPCCCSSFRAASAFS